MQHWIEDLIRAVSLKSDMVLYLYRVAQACEICIYVPDVAARSPHGICGVCRCAYEVHQ